jgi:UV DNA damage endonuclease
MTSKEVVHSKHYSVLSGHINLGLCTVNHELAIHGICPTRTLEASEFSLLKAREMALKNISDLLPIFKWNAEHGIYCYRVPQCLFPCIGIVPKYSLEFATEALQLIGQGAKLYKQRLTIHSSLLNHLGSPKSNVVEATIKELNHQANVLDLMGVDDSVIVIHGGGTYKDKARTKLRWIQNFSQLSSKVKSRLGIENCERNYNVEDVLEIAEACNIPVVFDLFHHPCYNYYHSDETQTPIEDLFPRIIATWKGRRMLMHISEQFYDPEADKLSRIGKHSEYINDIPIWILNLIKQYSLNVDIEVEATGNERAILQLHRLYPHIFTSNVDSSVDHIISKTIKLRITENTSTDHKVQESIR